jgi:RimJ/RimL family protein N-acetyltransferase
MQDGLRLVGYWVGREFWGADWRLPRSRSWRPRSQSGRSHAWVATSNVGSTRVLEKCGFVAVERRDEHTGRVIEEILYRLD